MGTEPADRQVPGLQGDGDTSDGEKELEGASEQLETEAPPASGELGPPGEWAAPGAAAAAAASPGGSSQASSSESLEASASENRMISPMLSNPSPPALRGESLSPVTRLPSAGRDSMPKALLLPEIVQRVSSASTMEESTETKDSIALPSVCGLRPSRAPSQPSAQTVPMLLTCEMGPTSDLGVSSELLLRTPAFCLRQSDIEAMHQIEEQKAMIEEQKAMIEEQKAMAALLLQTERQEEKEASASTTGHAVAPSSVGSSTSGGKRRPLLEKLEEEVREEFLMKNREVGSASHFAVPPEADIGPLPAVDSDASDDDDEQALQEQMQLLALMEAQGISWRGTALDEADAIPHSPTDEIGSEPTEEELAEMLRQQQQMVEDMFDLLEEELQRQSEQKEELGRLEKMEKLKAILEQERFQKPIKALPYLWEAGGAPVFLCQELSRTAHSRIDQLRNGQMAPGSPRISDASTCRPSLSQTQQAEGRQRQLLDPKVVHDGDAAGPAEYLLQSAAHLRNRTVFSRLMGKGRGRGRKAVSQQLKTSHGDMLISRTGTGVREDGKSNVPAHMQGYESMYVEDLQITITSRTSSESGSNYGDSSRDGSPSAKPSPSSAVPSELPTFRLNARANSQAKLRSVVLDKALTGRVKQSVADRSEETGIKNLAEHSESANGDRGAMSSAPVDANMPKLGGVKAMVEALKEKERASRPQPPCGSTLAKIPADMPVSVCTSVAPSQQTKPGASDPQSLVSLTKLGGAHAERLNDIITGSAALPELKVEVTCDSGDSIPHQFSNLANSQNCSGAKSLWGSGPLF